MKRILKGLGLGVFFLGLIGCGDQPEGNKKPEAEGKEEGHDHGSESSGATYEEGKGITLLEETKTSLGLELLEVSESAFQSEVRLTAQIYRSAVEASKVYGQERQGNAYATALVSSEVAKQLKSGQKLKWDSKKDGEFGYQGVIFKIDPAQLSTLGKSEAILEIPDKENRLKVVDFIEVEVPLGNASQKHLNIPRSSVLETSTGTFAFVKNGDFLVRTEIKIGTQNKDFVEITEGLYEGDTIAVKPVEALYLIELRSTKGGGHSH
jgi:multidrug efflux pump subunit AcrA (membrane-fusion protein)